MDRLIELATLEAALSANPVVAILGARQVGKTTLARALAARRRGKATFFDLERPEDLRALTDPFVALEGIEGLIVLDEIQRRPELFQALRVLADRRPVRARFLVLGSASPELLRQSSESLAGRIHYHELAGFALDEVGTSDLSKLWLRGGFPRSFLARSTTLSFAWREDFIRTFLERDIPQLGPAVPAPTLHRFWTMVAHYHAQTWNGAELARAFALGETTVRRYLDLLTATFMVRQLQPWHENIGKRLVKAPKIYLTDSGLLHALLGIRDAGDLDRHPKVGASWEGYALAAVERRLGTPRCDSHFWATHGGAEIDLVVAHGRHRLGFEFKRTTAPEVTRSMRIAIEDLDLARIDVVHAGQRTFPLASRIRALALSRVLDDLDSLT